MDVHWFISLAYVYIIQLNFIRTDFLHNSHTNIFPFSFWIYFLCAPTPTCTLAPCCFPTWLHWGDTVSVSLTAGISQQSANCRTHGPDKRWTERGGKRTNGRARLTWRAGISKNLTELERKHHNRHSVAFKFWPNYNLVRLKDFYCLVLFILFIRHMLKNVNRIVWLD